MNATITTITNTNAGYYNVTTHTLCYRMVIVTKKFDTNTSEYALTTVYGEMRKDKYAAAVDVHAVRYNAYQKDYTVETDGETMTISTQDEILTVTIESL